MTAKKPPSVKTVNGTISVDPEAYYRITLGKTVKSAGHVIRPTDTRIEVTGAALIAIAADAEEGAIVDAEVRT